MMIYYPLTYVGVVAGWENRQVRQLAVAGRRGQGAWPSHDHRVGDAGRLVGSHQSLGGLGGSRWVILDDLEKGDCADDDVQWNLQILGQT